MPAPTDGGLPVLQPPGSGGGGRRLGDEHLQPDAVLVAQGWERRFLADEARAEEAADLYRSLGFEVRAEPVRPPEGEDCSDCRELIALHFKVIYTRRPPAAEEGKAP